MIETIHGKVIALRQNYVILEVGGIGLGVLIPAIYVEQGDWLSLGNQVILHTILYVSAEKSRINPMLIGFKGERERDFFEQFVKVGGVGPRVAAKAMIMPVHEIAQAIERGDIDMVKSLPGIGKQKARDIVARLQGKMGEFCLESVEAAEPFAAPGTSSLRVEIIQVLAQLGYTDREAHGLVNQILASGKSIGSVEEFLKELYKL